MILIYADEQEIKQFEATVNQFQFKTETLDYVTTEIKQSLVETYLLYVRRQGKKDQLELPDKMVDSAVKWTVQKHFDLTKESYQLEQALAKQLRENADQPKAHKTMTLETLKPWIAIESQQGIDQVTKATKNYLQAQVRTPQKPKIERVKPC